jgi:hypothetical protein
MKALLFIVLAAACATAHGPKRPDESHRVLVNRTLPADVEGSTKANEAASAQRQPRRASEVEWR